FSPELRGKGTTTSTTNYAFLDANVETGQTYTYQLRSVDFDGTVHDYAQRVTVEVREPISPPRYSYNLEQNYPNPFNPTTNIRYSIQQTGLVTLKVYDLLGREVATLVNEVQPPGNYEVQFNASTRTSSGIYIYRLQSGNFTRTMKMMLVK
ncbi:MAG: T9SS type A sorting domain-containing protein, partial [Chloroherpetonaceae bacterium]|nr:T9SS type A sorting domain-containing protein [Chloroherpetonaceae bacterium]